MLSTGASTYDEIDFAVKLLQKKNVKKIGILQCTAKYPADIKILNLNVISNFKKKYQLPVGFSDHSLDPIIGPIMAVGLGATFIEKHFTLNKNLPGPDHSFALEPNDLELMIKTIRDADLAKGSGKKEILKDEQELHRFATRSIQAIKSIKKGDIFQEGINFEILRPGEQIRGLDARFLAKIEGKKALNDIDVGNGITDSI